MTIQQIFKNYEHLTLKQQNRFVDNFFMLLQQVQDALALRAPFSFVLDSNILMRLEDMEKGEFHEGVLAILLFFEFYKTQSVFHGDLRITPVVFYEFQRQQKLNGLKEHWDKFKSVRALVEDALDIEVLFENLDSFEKAEHFMSTISNDSAEIKTRLQVIEENDFDYDLVRDFGEGMGVLLGNGKIELPPSSAADNLYEEVDTEYFHPSYVGLFLKDHIAYKVSKNRKNYLSGA